MDGRDTSTGTRGRKRRFVGAASLLLVGVLLALDCPQPAGPQTPSVTDRPDVAPDGPTDDVVVLEFWSTTCAPCIDKLPQTRQLIAAYADFRVRFVSLVPDTASQLRRFEAEHGPLPFHETVVTADALISAYDVEAYPTYVVIDRGGQITARFGYNEGLEHARSVLNDLAPRRR